MFPGQNELFFGLSNIFERRPLEESTLHLFSKWHPLPLVKPISQEDKKEIFTHNLQSFLLIFFKMVTNNGEKLAFEQFVNEFIWNSVSGSFSRLEKQIWWCSVETANFFSKSAEKHERQLAFRLFSMIWSEAHYSRVSWNEIGESCELFSK